MKNYAQKVGLMLFMLAAALVFSMNPPQAMAQEVDLRHTVGRVLQETIRTVVPPVNLEHVTVDRLTINEKGKVRGKITIQYAGRRFGIPWSARIVVHLTTHYLDPAPDIRIDVGHCKGCIDTGSVKRVIGNWLVKQRGHLKQFIKSDPPPLPPNAKPYAVVCLVNKTGWDINYKFRWGDKPWQSKAVSQGKSRWHAFKYAFGSAKSPAFRISFDTDFSGNDQWRSYTLKRYQAVAKECKYGKRYAFVKTGANFVKLVAQN